MKFHVELLNLEALARKTIIMPHPNWNFGLDVGFRFSFFFISGVL